MQRAASSSVTMKNAPCCAFTSGEISDIRSRETVARSRWPCIWLEIRARFVFSQSCSAFCWVVSRRFAIIWFTRSLSSATSPEASTVICRVRSPWVTAEATSAIARTCVVRFDASWFTDSVSAAPRAADAFHLGLAAELALGAHLARDARDLAGERAELVDHRVDRPLELEDLALGVDRDLLRQVALGHGGGDLRDVADLARQVVRELVDVLGQAAPGAGDALDLGLAAELALRAHLARHARDLVREGRELVDHRVDGVLELEDLALGVDRDLARQVAAGDRGGHAGDAAHLIGQVRRHQVHVLGEPAPRAGHAFHLGLAAQLALGAHLARDARDLGRRTRAAGRPSC